MCDRGALYQSQLGTPIKHGHWSTTRPITPAVNGNEITTTISWRGCANWIQNTGRYANGCIPPGRLPRYSHWRVLHPCTVLRPSKRCAMVIWQTIGRPGNNGPLCPAGDCKQPALTNTEQDCTIRFPTLSGRIVVCQITERVNTFIARKTKNHSSWVNDTAASGRSETLWKSSRSPPPSQGSHNPRRQQSEGSPPTLGDPSSRLSLPRQAVPRRAQRVVFLPAHFASLAVLPVDERQPSRK